MEKPIGGEICPPYTAATTVNFERPVTAGRRSLFAASGVAIATSGALIVIVIVGALYIRDLKHACPGEGSSTSITDNIQVFNVTYMTTNNAFNQIYEINLNANTEIIHKTYPNGSDEMVAVYDYDKAIMGMYIPQANECLLIAGFDSSVSLVDKITMLKDNKVDLTVQGSSQQISLTRTSEAMIKDLSILPEKLLPYCAGKDVFWAGKMQASNTTSLQATGREKRSICCNCPICHYYCLFNGIYPICRCYCTYPIYYCFPNVCLCRFCGFPLL